MRFRIALATACAVRAVPLIAQTQTPTPLTRTEAVRTAIERGARLGVEGADTAVANAQVIAARALPNPSLSASYSRSVPTYHVIADMPIDLPNVRGLRIRS